MSENKAPLFYPIAGCETAFDRSHQVVTLLLKYFDDQRAVSTMEGLRMHVDQAQQLIAALQQAVETAKSQPRVVN
ncbi:hypothetical protein [Paraburkholderia tropica]|uniref:hypothetical protein n=1 Tax=Paraburkholderia tropica TaxID=92647 RepID=UPI002AB6ADFF|nr:hypothetical protein [Paraburkholderia tropica]